MENILTKTYTAIAVGSKTILLKDGANTDEYLDEVVDKYTFEYTLANTGDLIFISDLITEYNLRVDNNGNYGQSAYRIAYGVSFARTVCPKITINKGNGETKVFERVGNGILAKSDVESISPEIIVAFSSYADPSKVSNDEYELLLKKKKVKEEVPVKKTKQI